MNLLSILCKSLLADGALSALAKKTGLSASKLKKLIPLAVPVLLKALTNNASSQSGVLSLLGALGQHKSTKSLDVQISEADEADGSKILGHILGGQTDETVTSLAAQSGLSQKDVGLALSNIAPALLSGLSAATASAKPQQTANGPKFDLSDGLDLGDVMAIFGSSANASSSGGLLDGLLGGGSKPSSGGLLDGLLGGGSKPASGGLLGALLGGGASVEKDDSFNGTALLSALLKAKL